MTLIDGDMGGLIICTSSTRPTTTYAGMMAFETDTALMIIRNGANSAWLLATTVVTCTSVTRPTSTHAGMLIYETDTQYLVMRNSANSAWIVRLGGQTLRSTANDTTTTNGTTYSQGTGGTMPGIAFVGPPSGEVLIHYSAALTCGAATAAATLYYTPHIRNGAVVGSGTDFLVGTDNDAVQVAGSVFTNRVGSSMVIPGLTAGTQYNARMDVKSFGATAGTVAAKKLVVQPI